MPEGAEDVRRPPISPDPPNPPVPPAPVLPGFAGPCLVNVVPMLLACTGAGDSPGSGSGPGAREGWTPARPGTLPAWAPAPLEGADQVVLLVLDGLGWEQLRARPSVAPTLSSGVGGPITSVAPSTTAAALTSLSTGLPPAVHGVMGYRVRTGGGILNVLRWEVDGIDARQSLPPLQFQHYPALRGPHHEHGGGLADRRSSGEAVPVVSRADYAATGFSAAHLSGTVLHGWHTASGVVVDVLELVRNGAPFVYAYYDGVDRVAHAKGLGAHYDAELRAVDRLVGDIIDGLPAGAALVVTADHGQVDVGPSVEVLGREVMDGVELLSGEGRFRWLHTRAGAVEDVWSAAQEAFGHLAWVRTREEAIEEGWFGGEPTPEAAERLGDVLLAPFIPTAFLDPADTGEQRLVGRHGSLTPAEMLVPLIAWTPGR